MSETIPEDRELNAATAALLALARHNVPVDIQEMLVRGNDRMGVKPGALSKAIVAALAAIRNPMEGRG